MTDTYPASLAYALRSFARNAPDQKAVLTFLSRSLNLLTGGSPDEIFCSRAYRNEWRICPYIDGMFQIIGPDEKGALPGLLSRTGTHSAAATGEWLTGK